MILQTVCVHTASNSCIVECYIIASNGLNSYSYTSKLKEFLNYPLVLSGTINHPNIYLATHQCNLKKTGGLSRSFGMHHRDFNDFADEVSSLIGRECSIVYTDFANHVGPILMALRDQGVQAIGYYEKMSEREKADAK